MIVEIVFINNYIYTFIILYIEDFIPVYKVSSWLTDKISLN